MPALLQTLVSVFTYMHGCIFVCICICRTIHLEENKISKWDTFEYELRDEIMNYFNHSDGWTRIDTRHEDKVIHFRFGAYEYHKATTDSVV